ncbi:hypothetical protein ZWY2020_051135 [Hordeum vulgare]|nr:hypothetical protein ZWY2020_051135 [Hordeum vulgare]
MSAAPYLQSKKMKREDGQQGEEQSFPEDVLIEILSRVPYTSLFHFKRVSMAARPLLRPRRPQEVAADLVRLLLLQPRLAFPEFVRVEPSHRRLQSPFLARQL